MSEHKKNIVDGEGVFLFVVIVLFGLIVLCE